MNWKFKLNDDYHHHCPIPVKKTVSFCDKNGKCWLKIYQGINSSTIKVSKDYAWDGCSPKIKIGDLMLLGVPDGTPDPRTRKPKTYYASLVHDALYQFLNNKEMPYSRKQMDEIFRKILLESKFSLANVYYYTVRVLGGAFNYLNKKRI